MFHIPYRHMWTILPVHTSSAPWSPTTVYEVVPVRLYLSVPYPKANDGQLIAK